jgi:Bacteriophage Lambda NinG protein
MIRTRTRKCKICRAPFVPLSITSKVCSVECSLEHVARQKVIEGKRQDAKEAKAHKAALQAARGIKPLEDAAQKATNRVVRARDRFQSCFTCDKPWWWTGGDWHASHLKSRAANSALRYHLWNIHKSCMPCNRFHAGNVAVYERRIVDVWGQERLDWLTNHPRVRRFEPEYLKRLTKIMNKKAARQEIRNELEIELGAG